MNLGAHIESTYTFLVAQEIPPVVGDRYMDPKGRTWSIVSTFPQEDQKNSWLVTLKPKHSSFTISTGVSLRPLVDTHILNEAQKAAQEDLLGTTARVGIGYETSEILVWVDDPAKVNVKDNYFGVRVKIFRGYESKG